MITPPLGAENVWSKFFFGLCNGYFSQTQSLPKLNALDLSLVLLWLHCWSGLHLGGYFHFGVHHHILGGGGLQKKIPQSGICPAPCVLCQCTVVFAWKCRLFCLCTYRQCRIYYIYHVKFYFWFGHLVSFPAVVVWPFLPARVVIIPEAPYTSGNGNGWCSICPLCY